MAKDEPNARKVARSVVLAGKSHSTSESESGAAAAACGYLYNELSRWIGPEGCHALFSRALAEALRESPLLQSIQLSARTVPYVQGLEATVTANGDAETAAGIEVLLIRLVELLGRLIGDEMAMKLIEPVLAKSGNASGQAATAKERE